MNLANLAANELLRVDKAWTQDLFLQKIKDATPFTLDKGGKKVTLAMSPSDFKDLEKIIKNRNSTKLNNFIFQDTTGELYQGSGRFKKTPEFGSSGGSGAGSDVTDIAESAQCVYNVCYIQTKGFKIEDLRKAYASRMVDVTAKIEDIEKLPEAWKKSSMLTAKGMSVRNGWSAFMKNSYTQHRQSTFVGVIENKFAELNQGDQKNFANINKWNPADMWIVKTAKQREIQTAISKVQNIVQYNALLEEYVNNNLLLGVSLKQVKANPQIVWKNYKHYRAKTYKFKEFTLGKKAFNQSIDTFVYYNEGAGKTGQMQFRTFGTTSWQGEIKGLTANMGKVSGVAGPRSAIGKICKKVLKEDIERGGDLKSDFYNNFEEKGKQFFEYYKSLGETEYKDAKSFLTMIMAHPDPQSFFVSKYLGVQLMSYINKASQEDKDLFISSLLAYAGSESELSGPYIKVYN